MNERKPWEQQEDKQLRQIIEDNEEKLSGKLKWGDIAEVLREKTKINRTGKQCRERWHNQLKPGIQNQRQWSQEQIETLFRVQQEVGNRWAQIAKQLPGRTDNNIKNYFYSTLRKALRKVNSYVALHKREGPYRNVKEFKQQTLSKILTVAEHKYENKINLKRGGVEFDARQIKKILVEIQNNDEIMPSSEYDPQLQTAVQKILQFNRNCKRRKGKRKDSEEAEQNSIEDDVPYMPRRDAKSKAQSKQSKKTIKRQQSKRKKTAKKQQEKEEEDIIMPVGEPILLNSRKYSNKKSFMKRASSIIRERQKQIPLYLQASSSFRQCPAQNGFSQTYNPMIDSRHYFINNGPSQFGFLSSIPNLQRKRTSKSQFIPDFWKEDLNIPINVNLMDQSRNANTYEDNPIGLSMSLGQSTFLQRRTSNRLEKKQSEANK